MPTPSPPCPASTSCSSAPTICARPWAFRANLKHPKLRAAYESVAKACAAHKKILGVGGIRGDVAHVAELVKLGARFVIAGSDVQYLMRAARDEVAALRKAGAP